MATTATTTTTTTPATTAVAAPAATSGDLIGAGVGLVGGAGLGFGAAYLMKQTGNHLVTWGLVIGLGALGAYVGYNN